MIYRAAVIFGDSADFLLRIIAPLVLIYRRLKWQFHS